MSATKPTRPAVTNVIRAIVNAGLVPGAVHVTPDGGFHVQIFSQTPDLHVAPNPRKAQNGPVRFEDLQ